MSVMIRPCFEKTYLLKLCKPKIGTCIINKFDQVELLEFTNGKDYFSADEMKYLRVYDYELYNYLKNNGSIVSEDNPYIGCGLMGELYVLSVKEVKEIISSSDFCKLNSSDWLSFETKKNEKKNFAEFVPLDTIKFVKTLKGIRVKVNNPSISCHGKGDFIIYGSLKDGTPNFYDMKVVNGEIFKLIYETEGWEDCLA